MFDLEKAVVRWRERQERAASLAPRELDELEDHLRARFELELDSTAAPTPATAFATARDGLGQATTLSREFAKAGRPRWKRLLVTGWVLFGVSFTMPAMTDSSPFGRVPPPPPPGAIAPLPWTPSDPAPIAGWEAFALAMRGVVGPLGVLSALSNLLIPVVGLGALRGRPVGARWTAPLLAGAMAVNLLLWTPSFVGDLRVGYYLWLASFALVAAALWIRDREWASASVEEIVV